MTAMFYCNIHKQNTHTHQIQHALLRRGKTRDPFLHSDMDKQSSATHGPP